jgi:hypothetical protein
LEFSRVSRAQQGRPRQQKPLLSKEFPEPNKGGRGKKNSLKFKGFNKDHLSEARTIIHWAPDIAERVIAANFSTK